MNQSDPNFKTFISYSWEDDDHKLWVKSFATRLRTNGINVTLDQWHAAPGDQLPEFMERSIRENQFVLIICTPKYKERSELRKGGVGYEGDIITGEVFNERNQRKFIPILRKGDWQDAAPNWLAGKYYIDLRGESYLESNYSDLLATIQGKRETAPPIGPIVTGDPDETAWYVLWYADGAQKYGERPWFTMADIFQNYYTALDRFYQEGSLSRPVDICVSNFPKCKDEESNEDQALDERALEAILIRLVMTGYLKRMGKSVIGEKYEITDQGTYFFNTVVLPKWNTTT